MVVPGGADCLPLRVWETVWVERGTGGAEPEDEESVGISSIVVGTPFRDGTRSWDSYVTRTEPSGASEKRGRVTWAGVGRDLSRKWRLTGRLGSTAGDREEGGAGTMSRDVSTSRPSVRMKTQTSAISVKVREQEKAVPVRISPNSPISAHKNAIVRKRVRIAIQKNHPAREETKHKTAARASDRFVVRHFVDRRG